jgi:hypothetical protein
VLQYYQLYNLWHGFKNKVQNTIKVHKQKMCILKTKTQKNKSKKKKKLKYITHTIHIVLSWNMSK